MYTGIKIRTPNGRLISHAILLTCSVDLQHNQRFSSVCNTMVIMVVVSVSVKVLQLFASCVAT